MGTVPGRRAAAVLGQGKGVRGSQVPPSPQRCFGRADGWKDVVLLLNGAAGETAALRGAGGLGTAASGTHRSRGPGLLRVRGSGAQGCCCSVNSLPLAQVQLLQYQPFLQPRFILLRYWSWEALCAEQQWYGELELSRGTWPRPTCTAAASSAGRRSGAAGRHGRERGAGAGARKVEGTSWGRTATRGPCSERFMGKPQLQCRVRLFRVLVSCLWGCEEGGSARPHCAVVGAPVRRVLALCFPQSRASSQRHRVPGWGFDGWLPRAGRVGRGARGVGGVRVWQQVTLGRLPFLPPSQPAGAAEVALQAQPPLREPPKADARGRRGGHQGTAWIFPRVVPGSALPPPPFPAPALRSPATSPGGCSGGQGDVTAPAGREHWQQGCPGSLTGCAESSCRSRGSCPGLGLDWAHWEHPTRPQRLFPGDRRCLCLRRLPRWPREPGWGCCSKRVARGALPGSLLGDHRAGESCLGKKLRAPD